MSRSQARFYRSIVLGVLALGSLVWVATDQFDIPRENMGWLLLYTMAGVACIITIAAICVGLLIGLRKLRERD